MKLYIVSSGEYEDYHLCAIATSMDDAKALVNYYKPYEQDDVDIEEYDTDMCNHAIALGKQGKTMWTVCFNKKGYPDNPRCTPWVEEDIRELESEFMGYSLVVAVAAKDEEDALKIAKERRLKYLAEKEG